jgi:hypothetical protein
MIGAGSESSEPFLRNIRYSLHTGVISAFRLLEVVFEYNNIHRILFPLPYCMCFCVVNFNLTR